VSYEQTAKEQLARFGDNSVLLAIESSCDETAAVPPGASGGEA
jgi:hypothetical protein